MKKQIKFTREYNSVFCKVSRLELSQGLESNDFSDGLMTLMLKQIFYSTLSDTKDLEYTFNRPTFLEWILRKKKIVNVKCEVKDVLINPPKMRKETVRTYIFTTDEKDN